ncbi:hypothetical protein FISHEDRAFT_39003 [Fistulina hepatica ATCC 64428]|uniref:Phosphatidylglycerol/phosphatidylinositol transfer protein n=1 Tax=Fistulina hepatica ATCC 64428 TaxID=1128425 RepID=A0A0D7AGN7_9AGAR|nr:hypothetical protein FISHEDRAFT_39003 [Fistulina hepatica ATCC 64428]
MVRIPVFVAFTLAAVVAASPLLQNSLVTDGDVNVQESWGYVDCGLPEYPIQLESITVSPDPPKPGETLTVTVKAEVFELIEEGASADVTVKLGLVKLLQKQFDICEEARNANATVQCPIEPGNYTVVQSVDLPKEIPPAKFVVSVRGYTVDEDDLACVDLKIDFMKKFPSINLGW